MIIASFKGICEIVQKHNLSLFNLFAKQLLIVSLQRICFGYAHSLHLYSDYSILVSDFLAHGTLLVSLGVMFKLIFLYFPLTFAPIVSQDAINTNVCTGVSMDEVLCIHYTIEMLSMLETLHGNGIIHGDFKPDNLLMRYAR